MVHQRAIEADGFKDLRALVALQRGDAHFREGLEQAFVDGLHVIFENLVPAIVHGKRAVAVQILERLDGQIRIHGAGPITEQQSEVHDFAGLAGLDDQRHLVAGLFANQMVVHGGERQQAGNRRVLVVHAAVGKNQQRKAAAYRFRGAAAKIFHRLAKLLLAGIHAKQHGQRGRSNIAPVHLAQLFQSPVGDDGVAQLQGVRVLGRLIEDVSFAPDVGVERHHQSFADRIDRRIGDLREGLLEIIKQQLRLVRQASQRSVDAHRPDALLGFQRRRPQDRFQIFVGVSEGALAHQDRFVIGLLDVRRAGQVIESNLILPHPLRVGLPVGKMLFYLFVADQALLLGIHQQHAARARGGPSCARSQVLPGARPLPRPSRPSRRW